MSLTSIQRSEVFRTYNHLRGSDSVEKGRLNRALGLAQTGEERPYRTTLQYCSCPDFAYRRQKCKHIAALELQQAAERAEPEPARHDIDEINRDLFGD